MKKTVELEHIFVITVRETMTHIESVLEIKTNKNLQKISTRSLNNYYQGFVSFINESVMEDSQALISPDTHKLGESQKPIKKSDKAKTFRNINL